MSGSPKADPARQAGVLVLGTTIATIASAVAPLLIVRLLGKADVARLMSVTLVYETLALLLSSGLPYTLLYQLSNREAPERAAIARRSLSIGSWLGVVGALLVALADLLVVATPLGHRVEPITAEQLRLTTILAPSLIADLPSRMLPNLLVAERKAQRSAVFQVVRTLALTSATLVPLALQMSVEVVIICYAVVRWCFGPWVLLELRRLYRSVPRLAAPVTVKGLLGFAIPIGATDALGSLNAQLDRWLVLLVLPGTRLADYQIGAWQVPIIGTIAMAVGSTYTAEFVRHFQARQPYEAIALWRRGIHKVSLIVVPVTMALVVGAEELMSLLFTKAYADAASIFRFYSVLTFLRVAAFGTMIVSAGRPGYVVRAAAFGLFWNVLFSVPLVFTLGFIGPAIGTALAFVFQVGTYVYYIARAADVPVRRVFPLADYLRVLALAIVAGAAGWVVKWSLAPHDLAALVVEILVVLGTFALLGTVTRTIERADWAYLRDWLKLRVVR